VDFTLTDHQHLVRDSVRTMLAKECPTSLVRSHIEDPHAVDALDGHLAEFVEVGDDSLVDLCLVLEEMGAVVAPGTFFATAALARPLARAAGIEAAGTATVALAGASGEWVVNDDPRKTFVPEADRVAQTLVVGRDGVTVAESVSAVALSTIDPSRRLFDVEPSRQRTGTHTIAADDLSDWLSRAFVAIAAEMVGTARTLLAMSIDYAQHRVQFDRPIGSFQALQHKLADMALAWERAWGAVYYAAMAHDAGDADRLRAGHVAKAAAGNAAIVCARDGIQVHGGIGYTWEHDLHLFLRRAYGSEHLLGTRIWHHDRLGELLFS